MLYSNVLQERLQAVKAVSKDSDCIIKEITNIKNHYWFGSANAWLVFLGISPGGSPPKGKEDISNYLSQISFTETSDHLSNFFDKKFEKGFWAKIRQYIEDLFPDIDKGNLYRTTLTGNLTDQQQGDSKKLDKTDVEKGAYESFKVLSLVKPKLIICLQKDVYTLIHKSAEQYTMNNVKENHELKIDSGLKNNITYKVPVTFFQSQDESWGKWVLTRVPMHPSRYTFCNEENFKKQFLKKLRPMVNKFVIT